MQQKDMKNKKRQKGLTGSHIRTHDCIRISEKVKKRREQAIKDTKRRRQTEKERRTEDDKHKFTENSKYNREN